MKKAYSRRQFIKTSGAITAGFAFGRPQTRLFGKPSANETIRLGIIGTGDRGAWLGYILRNYPKIQLTACCDIIPKHLQDGLEQASDKAIGYDDYRKLLENKDLDAVIIATPQHLHTRMAIDALDAGKHVFCEKTLTYSIEETVKLVKRVKKSPLVFQVGYQWRTNPQHKAIYDVIQEGHCGPLTHIFCHYNRNGNWRTPVSDPSMERQINWRMYREYSGGLMAELCSHQIDITNWILNARPLKVTGFGGIDYWKDGRETYDNVHVVFEYPGGIKAMFTSITTNASIGVSMKFLGKEAAVEISKEEGHTAHIYAEKKPVPEAERGVDAVSAATQVAWEKGEAIPIPVENAAKDDEITSGIALKHFADCIRDNRTPASNIDTGRDAAIAVHMAIKAMRQGTVEYWKEEYS